MKMTFTIPVLMFSAMMFLGCVAQDAPAVDDSPLIVWSRTTQEAHYSLADGTTGVLNGVDPAIARETKAEALTAALAHALLAQEPTTAHAQCILITFCPDGHTCACTCYLCTGVPNKCYGDCG